MRKSNIFATANLVLFTGLLAFVIFGYQSVGYPDDFVPILDLFMGLVAVGYAILLPMIAVFNPITRTNEYPFGAIFIPRIRFKNGHEEYFPWFLVVTLITFMLLLWDVPSKAQDVRFTQAYMVSNDTITVINNCDFSLKVNQKSLQLTSLTFNIDSTKVRNKALVLFFSNGWIGEYYQDPNLGDCLSIIWKAGRLVMWRQYAPSYLIIDH